MTQDEIIELSIQGHASTRDAIRWAMNQEREACAKVCEEYETNNDIADTWLNIVSEVIRARGQA